MRPGRAARALTAFGVAFLTVPSLLILIAALTPGEQIAFPPKGITLHWFGKVVEEEQVWISLGHSLYAATLSVVLCGLVAVPAALALSRMGGRAQAFTTAFLNLGITTPLIVSSIGFLILFTELRVISHLTVLGVALAVVQLPFMMWATLSAMAGHNPELEQAAETMGAEPIQCFLFITFPALLPGVVTGALLAFVLSLTDFVVSVILTNLNDVTLPVYVYSGIRTTVSPILGAVSLVFVLVSMLAFALVARIGRLDRLLAQGR